MTDNQFKQMMNIMTKCVNGIQDLQKDMKEAKADISELKTDVSEIKAGQVRLESDVTELKDGQKRIEKDIHLINKSLDNLAGESMRVKARVDVLEEVFSH